MRLQNFPGKRASLAEPACESQAVECHCFWSRTGTNKRCCGIADLVAKRMLCVSVPSQKAQMISETSSGWRIVLASSPAQCAEHIRCLEMSRDAKLAILATSEPACEPFFFLKNEEANRNFKQEIIFLAVCQVSVRIHLSRRSRFIRLS